MFPTEVSKNLPMLFGVQSSYNSPIVLARCCYFFFSSCCRLKFLISFFFVVPWCSGYRYCTTTFNKNWSQGFIQCRWVLLHDKFLKRLIHLGYWTAKQWKCLVWEQKTKPNMHLESVEGKRIFKSLNTKWRLWLACKSILFLVWITEMFHTLLVKIYCQT